MKDLRELEAQHEATVSESATDDQKLRMHSEFTAICLTDESRLWSNELSDQQARINAKEVLITQKDDEFIFPVADGTAKF